MSYFWGYVILLRVCHTLDAMSYFWWYVILLRVCQMSILWGYKFREIFEGTFCGVGRPCGIPVYPGWAFKYCLITRPGLMTISISFLAMITVSSSVHSAPWAEHPTTKMNRNITWIFIFGSNLSVWILESKWYFSHLFFFKFTDVWIHFFTHLTSLLMLQYWDEMIWFMPFFIKQVLVHMTWYRITFNSRKYA